MNEYEPRMDRIESSLAVVTDDPRAVTEHRVELIRTKLCSASTLAYTVSISFSLTPS